MLTKPERPSIPIYVAALGQKNVEGTAEYADGWLPFLYAPEKAHDVWGDALAAGRARRPDTSVRWRSPRAAWPASART